MCKDFVPLLAKPDSLIARRTPFATKSIWVTPFKDGQFYPAGKFVTQTPFAPEDSVSSFYLKLRLKSVLISIAQSLKAG